MADYKEEFIKFALERKIIILETLDHKAKLFTLSSLSSGKEVHELQRFMVRTLMELPHFSENYTAPDFLLYGSGHAGEFLASGIAVRLMEDYSRDVRYTYKVRGNKNGKYGGSKFQSEDKLFILKDVLASGRDVIEELSSLPEDMDLIGIHSLVDRLHTDGRQKVKEYLEHRFKTKVTSSLNADDFLVNFDKNDSRRQVLGIYDKVRDLEYSFTTESTNLYIDEAIRDIVQVFDEVENLNGYQIPSLISRITGVSLEEIKPKKGIKGSRKRYAARARQLVMYLMRRKCKWAYPEIGRFLKLDHSTVVSGEKKIEEILEGWE